MKNVTDNLTALLEVLPRQLRETLEHIGGLEGLVEVVLDLGRRPEARYLGSAQYLSDGQINHEDLQYIISRVGLFGKDNRAGIERTLHRISAIRNRRGEIIGLTCRVGRAVYGTVDIIRDMIESGRSLLLLGRPGTGKTTMLREAARVLADDLGKRVIVVDTSNEIAGDGDIPHAGIGRARRMQVPLPELQHAVMIEAVENHMPEVIIIDEIGTQAETLAARTIAERGVQLIGTAHGTSLANLMMNPTLSDLVGGLQAVTLGDEEARRRGTQKTVLERKAPPAFDILIEILERDRLRVYPDVAYAVDQVLRSLEPDTELRTRTDTGIVEVAKSTTAPTLPINAPTRLRKGPLRIFPYAISQEKLARAINEAGVPVEITDELHNAHLVLTLKSQAKGNPKKLQEANARTIPIEVIRSNTLSQMTAFLREQFSELNRDEEAEALQEAEAAIAAALEKNSPVKLEPRAAHIRRLQHRLAERSGLASESKGKEPYRRVIIYP
ncbi:MAG: R3H domain-containing nucleic acid-binding protein [Acidobacteriota bacterium]